MIKKIISVSEKIVKKILTLKQFLKEPYYQNQINWDDFLVVALKITIPIFFILLVFNILATIYVFNIKLFGIIIFWIIDVGILIFIVGILFNNGKIKNNFSFNIKPEIAKLLYEELKKIPEIDIINDMTTIEDFVICLSEYRYNHKSHIIFNIKLSFLEAFITGLKILSPNNFSDKRFFELKLFYQYYSGKINLYKYESYRSKKERVIQKDKTFKKIIEIFKRLKNELI